MNYFGLVINDTVNLISVDIPSELSFEKPRDIIGIFNHDIRF
jgi:hypothetical protein